MIAEWSLQGHEGLRQVRKHARVEVLHPAEFYIHGVTVSIGSAAVSRMTLSPQRQFGPGYLAIGHTSTCVHLSGAATLATDSGPQSLNRGQVYSPRRASRDRLDVITPTQLVVVNPRLAPDLKSEPAKRNGNWRMPEASISLFESLCDWLCATSVEVPADPIEAAGAALLTLLDHPVPDVDRERPEPAGSTATLYEKAMRIVDAEFRNPDLNAPSLAKRLRISLRTLHRAFESHSASISQEIRRRRIEYAEMLLRSVRHSHMPVSEIARISGAPSVAYLRMGIKDKYDVSPTRLREMSMVGTLST
ncbi:MAG: AraC family transcriptional regulator [Nocardiaceae bacterium]|nr:AraC family transcriptional regulator [Nocardiaceae bacterium]